MTTRRSSHERLVQTKPRLSEPLWDTPVAINRKRCDVLMARVTHDNTDVSLLGKGQCSLHLCSTGDVDGVAGIVSKLARS